MKTFKDFINGAGDNQIALGEAAKNNKKPTDDEVVQGSFNDLVWAEYLSKIEYAKNMMELWEKVKDYPFEKNLGIKNQKMGDLLVFDKIEINKDATAAKIDYTYYVNTSDFNIEVEEEDASVTIKI